jgi:hypothetical protein
MTASSTATRSATPASNSAATWTPTALLTKPNTSENGRNTSQENVPTPDATPARTADGTASCSSRLTRTVMAISSRHNTICAAVISPTLRVAVSATAATVTSVPAPRYVVGRVKSSRPASRPPRP